MNTIELPESLIIRLDERLRALTDVIADLKKSIDSRATLEQHSEAVARIDKLEERTSKIEKLVYIGCGIVTFVQFAFPVLVNFLKHAS